MRYLILIATIIFIQSPVFALNEKLSAKLDLNEAVKLAVDKNIDLQKSRKDIEIAKNNIEFANRLQNPKIETMFLVGHTSLGNPQAVGLALPVEIMKRSARKEKATVEKDVVVTNVEAEAFNLKMSVRDAYVRLAAAKSILKVVERQQHVMEEMVDAAKNRSKKTQIGDVEVMQAELLRKQVQTAYNKAKTQVDTQRYYFNKVLNVGPDANYDIEENYLPADGQFLKLSTPLPGDAFISFEKVESLAMENRFDVQIAKREIDAAKSNLKTVVRQRIPDITVQGGYNYLTTYQNNDEATGNGPLSGAYVGGTVDLPVLYRFTPEIKNAKLEIEKRELAYLSVKNAAGQDLKKAYAQFELARKNLNYYGKDLMESSENTLVSSQKSYAEGKSDLSNLILVCQSHLDLMMDYTNALAAYYIEWIELLTEMNIENPEVL